MSYELAIINPRKTSKRRRRASAKQLAARRRFVSKFAKGRKARRRNPAKRRKSKPNYSGVSVMAKRRRRRSRVRTAKGRFVKGQKRVKRTAGRRRRRRSSAGARHAASGYTVGSGKIRRRKLNPRVRRRRYRRNPLGLGRVLSVNGIMGQLVPAAYGAGGAVVMNLALSYLPLPDILKAGIPKQLTRLGMAMAVGVLGRKFLGRRGEAMGAGALTVVVYDILKGLIATASPDIGARLGDFEDVSLMDDGFIDPASPVRGFGAYLEGGSDGDPEDNNGVDEMGRMGAYLEGDLDGNLDGVGAYDYV